jgi:hypothetical protein
MSACFRSGLEKTTPQAKWLSALGNRQIPHLLGSCNLTEHIFTKIDSLGVVSWSQPSTIRLIAAETIYFSLDIINSVKSKNVFK